MTALPRELLLQTANFLDIKALSCLTRTCRFLHALLIPVLHRRMLTAVPGGSDSVLLWAAQHPDRLPIARKLFDAARPLFRPLQDRQGSLDATGGAYSPVNLAATFRMAIRNDNVDMVALLIDEWQLRCPPDLDVRLDTPADLSPKDVFFQRKHVLNAAAKRGYVEIVKLLVERAKVDLGNLDRESTLHTVAKNGDLNLLRIIYRALNPGVDFPSSDEIFGTLIHIAAEQGWAEMAAILIDEGGMDVNLLDSYDRTPLGVALESSSSNQHSRAFSEELDARIQCVVALLIDRGALITTRPLGGHSGNAMPDLHRECEKRKSSCLDLLLNANGVDVSAPDRYGRTPLHTAAECGSITAVRKLLDKGARVDVLGGMAEDALFERSPLHAAAQGGFPAVCRLLLEAGAQVSLPGCKGKQAVHFVAWRKYGMDDSAAKVLKILIHAGADVNARDQEGSTPLHGVLQADWVAVSRLILLAGAHACPPDPKDSHAFHCAALNQSMTIIQALVDAGADVAARDDFDMTPLHYAAIPPEMIGDSIQNPYKILLDSGADPSARDSQGRTPLDMMRIYSEGL